ncbi:MAG: D-alanyl-D-alanine carboxypeptidase [Eubacteriales bacterium]|nr:D-alanyl-D-alanine carboxypeptidase [Eubacteriales bacterium]
MIKKIALVLVLAMALTGCTGNVELDKPYDKASSPASELLSERLTPFAADLCVINTGTMNDGGVNAYAYGYFDINGEEVLSCDNLFERVYPASTTKIMTCLLALEGANLEEEVSIGDAVKIDVSGSSMSGLKTGDRLKMKELLYALMVPSGNDAAASIAVHMAGSEEKFAELMTKRAHELGATHTNFTNPHGLPDENHYTTVYDMYLIFNEALKHDEFMEISSTPVYETEVYNETAGTSRKVTWKCGNGFYKGDFSLPEGITYIAGKTGHTNAAGFCLCLGEADERGNRYISIVMKSPTYEDLYGGMINLARKALV